MSIVKEFREFAIKGNVVDMAVGVIIGASFGKIVSSLVTDIITPPLGLILNGVDFKELKITLSNVITGGQAVTINYGTFIQTVFDFVIVALAMFAIIKFMNKIRKPSTMEVVAQSKQEELLTEIRDILKSK